MNADYDYTQSVPRTPTDGAYYLPWIESDSNGGHTLEFLYVPAAQDPIALARSVDPRRVYPKNLRKITMESIAETGRIVGGQHRLPTKAILYADVEARERALRPDANQYDEPSGTASWYYRADMAYPRPILPTSSCFRFQDSSSANSAGENIGIDPRETVSPEEMPAWRKDDETQSKKANKRFDPIQKNKKKASPRKRKNN